MAVKAGGTDPASNPMLRRTIQNARAVNMPKDKVDAAIKRASGRDAANYHEVLYEGYAPHGVALLVETATDNPTRTVAGRAQHPHQERRQPRPPTAASASCSARWACSASSPDGIDQDDLELYLIDHGLDEMGESTGEKGEPQLVIRVRVRRLRPPAGGPRGARHHPAVRRARVHLHRADRAARSPGHRSAHRHRQARTGRRRAERLPHPRLSRCTAASDALSLGAWKSTDSSPPVPPMRRSWRPCPSSSSRRA